MRISNLGHTLKVILFLFSCIFLVGYVFKTFSAVSRRLSSKDADGTRKQILKDDYEDLFNVNWNATEESFIKISELPASFRQSNVGEYINLLNEKPLEFLTNFKNPCWKEEVTSVTPYRDNFFLKQLHITGVHFQQSIDWRNHLAMGVHWRLRCLPYFYLAGFARSGTTQIYKDIKSHRMVCYAKKEINWWNRFRNTLPKGQKVPIRHYIDLYDSIALEINLLEETDSEMDTQHPMIFGDATSVIASEQRGWWDHPENIGQTKGKDPPRYINAHYIKHVTPQARIIMVMRDPVDRLYSEFNAHHPSNPPVFHDYVVKALSHMKKCISDHGTEACVAIPSNITYYSFSLRDSMYSEIITRWRKVFPVEQFHFIKLEEYSQNRPKELNAVFKFLGLAEITEDGIPLDTHQARTGCPQCPVPPMLDKTKILLQEFFTPYNKKLSELLGDEKWLFQ